MKLSAAVLCLLLACPPEANGMQHAAFTQVTALSGTHGIPRAGGGGCEAREPPSAAPAGTTHGPHACQGIVGWCPTTHKPLLCTAVAAPSSQFCKKHQHQCNFVYKQNRKYHAKGERCAARTNRPNGMCKTHKSTGSTLEAHERYAPMHAHHEAMRRQVRVLQCARTERAFRTSIIHSSCTHTRRFGKLGVHAHHPRTGWAAFTAE